MQPLSRQNQVSLDRNSPQKSNNSFGVPQAHVLRSALAFDQSKLSPSRKSFGCPFEQKQSPPLWPPGSQVIITITCTLTMATPMGRGPAVRDVRP